MRRGHAIGLSAAALLAAVSLIAATPGGAATPKPIEGRFDVGGHKLFLRCTGPSASGPTIVYLHGAIDNGLGGASSAQDVPLYVSRKHRMCVYDRANLGNSDKVPGPIGARQLMRDLHNLLAAAGVKPPFVLLGASFGGLVAYSYAVTYPKDVKGMLLLDAAFPDELSLEPLIPAKDRFTHAQWREGAEKIDQLDVYQYANARASRRPAIPVTYLLATPETWTGFSPAYDKVVIKVQAAYVRRFKPGVLKRVASPHWMESAVPERIAKELDLLLARIARG